MSEQVEEDGAWPRRKFLQVVKDAVKFAGVAAPTLALSDLFMFGRGFEAGRQLPVVDLDKGRDRSMPTYVTVGEVGGEREALGAKVRMVRFDLKKGADGEYDTTELQSENRVRAYLVGKEKDGNGQLLVTVDPGLLIDSGCAAFNICAIQEQCMTVSLLYGYDLEGLMNKVPPEDGQLPIFVSSSLDGAPKNVLHVDGEKGQVQRVVISLYTIDNGLRRVGGAYKADASTES